MILVTGGTGFIGRSLVRRLRDASLGVRYLVRTPERASALMKEGCAAVVGDVTDAASVSRAMTPDIEAVVHLVGILVESKRGGTFAEVHVEGTRNVVRACMESGVRRYLHVSALGARPGARSRYHRTKWEAEEIVMGSGLDFTIFRPSVVFGEGDMFTNLFAGVIRRSPFISLPGSGKNRIQPLYVGDLVNAMALSLADAGTKGRVFEAGGPEALTFDEAVDAVARALGKTVMKLHIPGPVMRAVALLAEMALPKPFVTRDQLLMLEEDNVTSERSLEEVFGIRPLGFEDWMRGYLH